MNVAKGVDFMYFMSPMEFSKINVECYFFESGSKLYILHSDSILEIILKKVKM